MSDIPTEDDYAYQHNEDDYPRGQWCRDIEGHKALHEFCIHHQSAWCRDCDRSGCPSCFDDPHCPDCGCALHEEYHDWDCSYAD